MAQEITALRKEGRIEEAFKLAMQSLSQQPDNIYTLRALCWVLYDKLKIAVEQSEHRDVIDIYAHINQLNIPKDENMFWERISMHASKYIWQLAKLGEVVKLLSFIESVILNTDALHSDYHRSKAKAIIHCCKHSDNLDVVNSLLLVEHIAPNSFQEEDYKATRLEGQAHSIPPLAESYYNIYAKLLLKAKDSERIKMFLPKLIGICEKYPNYTWCGYNAAKLMLLINEEPEKIRGRLRPLVQKKVREFWVWESYADTYLRHSDERYALLAKAILCPTKSQEMTVRLRKEMVRELFFRGLFSFARYEIDIIISLYKSQGWPVPQDIQACLTRGWYLSAECRETPESIYRHLEETAERLVFGEKVRLIVVITHINVEKLMASTISVTGKKGYFSYKALKRYTPQIGEVYELTLLADPEIDKPYKVCDVSKVKDEISTGLIKVGQGVISYKGQLAFIDEVYVPPTLVNSKLIPDKSRVSYVAYRSWNKSKDKFSWTCKRIKKSPC